MSMDGATAMKPSSKAGARHQADRAAAARAAARARSRLRCRSGVLVMLFYIVTLVKGPACWSGRCDQARSPQLMSATPQSPIAARSCGRLLPAAALSP